MTSQPSIRQILEILRCDIVSSDDDGTLDNSDKLQMQRDMIKKALSEIRKRIEGLKKDNLNFCWTDSEKQVFNLAINEVLGLFKD